MLPIFSLTKQDNSDLAETYKAAMQDLGAFFEMKWTRNRPKVFIVSSRADFDIICERETEDWLVGFGANKTVYLLDKDKFETESSHKYTPKRYSQLLKHELSHLFYFSITGSNYPIWLTDGLAIYNSGQVESRKKPDEFKSFLQYFKEVGKPVYEEAGLAIKVIIEEFGKGKLLAFIKSLKGIASQEQAAENFKNVFGLSLTYDNLNKLLSKHEKRD